MRRALPLAAVVVALTTHCAGEDPGVAAQPIIHGSASVDTPWAVMVAQQPAGSTRVRLCTGTVIAPRAVLTAKHCVYVDDGDGTWAAVPAGDLTVRQGDNFRASTRTTAVTEVRTTDGPYRDGDGRDGGDIALLITAEDLGVSPRPVSPTPAAQGDTLRIVGYGYTMPGAAPSSDLGLKHEGVARVATVEASVFSTTGAQWTCTGDSGGPALDALGRLVGVTSIGPAGCNVSTSYYTRVDRYLALFADVLPLPVDAGVPSAVDAPSAPADATVEDAAAPRAAPVGGCHVGRRDVTSPLALAPLLLALRRRRRALTPRSACGTGAAG